MDRRDLVLNYLREKYYQPNLSAEVARNLDMSEDELINNIHLINRENNGLVVLREGMGKNKYVLSLRPNSEQEISDFLNRGGFTNDTLTREDEAPKTAVAAPAVQAVKQGGAYKWIAIAALLFSLAALGLSVYNYLLLGGYL